MEGTDEISPSYSMGQIGQSKDLFPSSYNPNILKVPPTPNHVQLSSNIQPKITPLLHPPIEYNSKYKLNINSNTKEIIRPHPETIDPLIRAVNDISLSEWKLKRQIQKQLIRQQGLQQNQTSKTNDVDVNTDIMEKLEHYSTDDKEILKSNESIESTTSTVNIANNNSILPFIKDIFLFEISIPPGRLQVISMFINVLANTFPSWRCKNENISNNNIDHNPLEVDYLTLNYNKCGLNDSFCSKQDFLIFNQTINKHLQLQRYYCHLRNIELMAKGRHELTQAYSKIVQAITPTVYGDKLESIPPTFGALSLVVDTILLESYNQSNEITYNNWTYTESYKLDVIMKLLDLLVTERTCEGTNLDNKINMENPQIQDNSFEYLPTYPFQNKCCKYFSNNDRFNTTSYNPLQRYAICNTCLSICLCNCPIIQEFDIESEIDLIPSHLSNSSHIFKSNISVYSDFINNTKSHSSRFLDYNTDTSDHSSLHNTFEFDYNKSGNNFFRTLSAESSSGVSSYFSLNSNIMSSRSKDMNSFKNHEMVIHSNPSTLSHSSTPQKLHIQRVDSQNLSHIKHIKFISPLAHSINSENQILIQIIKSPYLRIMGLICDVLKIPIPTIEPDVFWWRYIESYFGKLLSTSSVNTDDTDLGKFLASILDIDKLVLELCGSLEFNFNNFKMLNPNCICVFVNGSDNVYRKFEKDKLGSWRFYTNAVEYMFFLKIITHNISFDHTFLCFSMKPLNSIKNTDIKDEVNNVNNRTSHVETITYHIYLNGIPSTLESIFMQRNPDHNITISNTGIDCYDIRYINEIYESISLEVDEVLMRLIESDTLESVKEMNNIQPMFKRNYFNISITANKYVLSLPTQFCGTCYPLRRQCIGSKRCFTCLGSKECIEEALKICNSTKHSLEFRNKEIIVTFNTRLGSDECIRLINNVEIEFVYECIFQTCKSVSSNKVAIISPVYKEVNSFSTTSYGNMSNAISEARKCCRELHKFDISIDLETQYRLDIKTTNVTEGSIGKTDWINLKEHLDNVFKKYNDRLGKRTRKLYQIKMCDDVYGLKFGDLILPIITENITNIATLGDGIIDVLRRLGRHNVSTVFVNNFDDVSPIML